MYTQLMKAEAAISAASKELEGASSLECLSFLFAMFDIVCDACGLSKAETLNVMNKLVPEINGRYGTMN